VHFSYLHLRRWRLSGSSWTGRRQKVQGFVSREDISPTIIVLGQEVAVVKERFFYLGSLVCSTIQSSPDISHHNAITRTAVQNLDNQMWKSRITISAKLKLYNKCILPSSGMALSAGQIPRDVLKINALDHWCLRKLSGIKWYHHVWNDEVRRTTGQPHLSVGYCPSTAFLPVRPHCANASRNRCQKDLNSFLLGELERPLVRPCTTCMKAI